MASKLRIGQPNRIRHTKNAQIGVAFQLGATKKLKMSAFGRKRKLGYLPLERWVQVRCSEFSEFPSSLF